MFKSLAAGVLAAVLIAGCGGGNVSPVEPFRIDTVASIQAPLRTPPALTVAALFAWAETNFPTYFAGTGIDGVEAPFTYRYYAQTSTYLAVADGNVYVRGPAVSNNQVINVGAFDSFTCRVYAAACDVPGDASTTSNVQPGGFVIGAIDPAGDVDWHAIFLTAGQPYVIDLEGSSSNRGTLGDPLLRLYDGAGNQLESDDDSGTLFDSRIVCSAPASGWYFLSAQGVGSQTGTYRISVNVSVAPAPACGSGAGDGEIDWESLLSAEDILSGETTLPPGLAQGATFQFSGGSQVLDAIFASQGAANVFLTTPETLASCIAGGAFTQFAQLSFVGGNNGWLSFTLEPGSYGLCVRDTSGANNFVRIELKKQLAAPGFHFGQLNFAPVARSVAPGGRFVQQAVTNDSSRTFIDGTNTGGSFYVIPASEEQKFLSGAPFDHYPDLTAACGASQTFAPGPCELTGVNDYRVAYWNNTTGTQSIVIVGRDYVPD
jgi:hypothetical protein